jgi:predicted NBD/HSP70 family sugar kinase
MFIAVDVGGTKTLVASVDDKGTRIKEVRFETPAEYQEFLTELASAISNVAKGKSPSLISMALPGLLDRNNGVAIAFGNLPWKNIEIINDVSTQTGVEDVLIENDAKLAALAEANNLSPLPHKVLYITVSTGIGAGLVIDGKLDPDFLDMEIGHMTVQHEGKLSGWEEIASGKAINAKFGKKVSEITEPEQLYYIGHVLALGINYLIATLTPNAIIVGGGAGAHLNNFKDQLLTELDIMSTDMITIPPITVAKDPEEAVVNGCIINAQQYLAHI